MSSWIYAVVLQEQSKYFFLEWRNPFLVRRWKDFYNSSFNPNKSKHETVIRRVEADDRYHPPHSMTESKKRVILQDDTQSIKTPNQDKHCFSSMVFVNMTLTGTEDFNILNTA